MKRILPVILILAVAGAGYWWFTRPSVAAIESTALLGSGSIEAETVAITAELGGRIINVKVDEGDEVAAGQVLVELDQSDLLAQQAQLEAGVFTTQANLELVSAAALPEDVTAAAAKVTQAEAARDGAKLVWERARALVEDPHQLEARLNQGEARVAGAEADLESAQVILKRAEIEAEAAGRNQSSHTGLVQAEAAQKQLEAAQIGVQLAQAALEGAKKQVEHLNRLRLMPLTLIVEANAAEAAYGQAQAGVQAAAANLNAVKAGPRAEDIAVAQAQVREAETALAVVEVQLTKQTLAAPRNGLISQKLVNAGELASPGAMLLELSDIETVKLTVYIPETQIGRVKIGQAAHVYVDAYPNDVFEGVVSFIAHEAEFTPRNVQTQEERVNLVFAVEIELDNADHRLKPGMPADAEILPGVQARLIQKTPLPTPAPTATVTARPTGAPLPAATVTAAVLTPTSVAGPTAAPAKPAAQAEIIAWGLKVRAGPGIDYPAIAHLNQGEVVAVLKIDPRTGWLQVELPGGETGWITGSQTYVSVK
ncbi:MAG: efflux RND transporter periplasmic adaptor subunit [Chloroflexota bacterium]